ncbi:hypothetical protein QQ054_36230 [Oscillatoria amoena NRMC-F 0135]|nr:hypothetical protein [Oscillatoria amoena NRMC-F 0135]
MNKNSISFKNLYTLAGKIFTASSLLFAAITTNAQDVIPGPGGPPPLCPISTPFTPRLGIGTVNKILIGGNGNNDGTICWNCYNDSVVYGRSKAFNMPVGVYAIGPYAPNFSSRITQDLQNSVMRWQIGIANCYDIISWQSGITMRTDGTIGIGTDETFGFKLAVNGGIAAKNDVFLTQTDLAWPDFVFTKGYHLKPLLLLEKEIDSLGHLPQMPSATEVKETGLSLAKVTATTVQKVEELTLYAIEQQKQLDELKKQNELLEKQNAELKKQQEELMLLVNRLLKEKE